MLILMIRHDFTNRLENIYEKKQFQFFTTR
jgi:hypothetical protein